MPEGDTIYRTATSLRRWLGGREVTAAHSRTPGVDLSGVIGDTLEAVDSHGKHLLLRFSGGSVLHTHMMMSGSWHVYPTGERWRRPARQARVVVEAGTRLAVCFNAPVVELLAAGDERSHPSLRRLGPDVLLPEALDRDVVLRRARGRAEASPTIGELLLDQQVVAGIGNIYRSESLFLCGIDPARPLGDVTDDEMAGAVTTASRLMRANATVGSPISRSFEGGPERPWVYGRSGLPCRRCGTAVRRTLLGGQARSVYWCPSCQPPGSDPRPLGHA